MPFLAFPLKEVKRFLVKSHSIEKGRLDVNESEHHLNYITLYKCGIASECFEINRASAFSRLSSISE